MATIAILPWLRLDKLISVDEFELIPFDQHTFQDKEAAQAVFSVVAMHYVAEKAHADRATLIRYADRDLLADLDEDERARLFDFVELLAYTGLSARKYFQRDRYCNRDHFQVAIFGRIVQDGGFTQRILRRDGAIEAMSKSPRFDKPAHVAGNQVVWIDLPLLEALVELRDNATPETWNRVFESILSYNHANTDSPSVPPHFEVMSLVGAFQRLLNTRSNGRELRERFGRVLAPTDEMDKNDAECGRFTPPAIDSRIQNVEYGSNVREVWMRDLCKLRNNGAHGMIEPEEVPIWSIRNHLLLASYAFPLVVKCYLADHGVYALTDEDQFDIDVFEKLACAEHFDDFHDGQYPWNEVRREAGWKRIHDILVERYSDTCQ